MDTTEIVKLIEQRPWILVAALVIGLAARLVKDDIKSTPNVPPRWRVWLVLGLGVLSGLMEKKWGRALGGEAQAQVTWIGGLVGGFVSAAFAIVGHNTIVGSLRDGKEFSIPWLTKIGVSPGPNKPVSLPPPTSPSPSSSKEEKVDDEITSVEKKEKSGEN